MAIPWFRQGARGHGDGPLGNSEDARPGGDTSLNHVLLMRGRVAGSAAGWRY